MVVARRGVVPDVHRVWRKSVCTPLLFCACCGQPRYHRPRRITLPPTYDVAGCSFGVVCFEVATRTEPFKGLKQTQVTRAVADKGKRPAIPEEASASPDVVPLMEHCWKQEPADRPAGFGPVVKVLERVVRRVGDPRCGSADTVKIASSSGVERGDTAPPTVSDAVDSSSGGQPAVADTAPSPDISDQPATAGSEGSEDGSTPDGDLSQHASEGTEVLDARLVCAPFADLPVARKESLSSRVTSSWRRQHSINMLGQIPGKKVRKPSLRPNQERAAAHVCTFYNHVVFTSLVTLGAIQ